MPKAPLVTIKNSFFPSTIIEWNNLDSNIRNSESRVYKAKARIKHLRFHKFKAALSNTLFPTCNYGTVETSIHNLLHCPNFSNERLILFNKLQSIDENILSKDHFNISKVLLFGDHSFNDVKKILVLTASIEYIIKYSLISKLTLIYLSICRLFSVFIKKLLVHLCYLL